MQTCDELPFALGWIAPGPAFMQRASHALVTEAGVYVIDPVDVPGAEQRIRELGPPAGVIQLLDRHKRDCETFAHRLGVPLHRVPFDGVPGSPFQVMQVLRVRGWKEIALWWPGQRVLVLADALGSAPFYRAPGEQLGVSPLLRAFPPRKLAERAPEHVLCGHGAGLHGPEATTALRESLAGARRNAPAWLVAQVRQRLGR